MILMHRDYPVADVDMIAGQPYLNRVFIPERMPIGTLDERKFLAEKKLQNWYRGRAIPRERQNLSKIERALGQKVDEALVKSLGVSLTDCYWLRPEKLSFLSWKDVNYHSNGFSEQLSNVILYNGNNYVTDFRLPDLTTDGILIKTWTSLNGIPHLVKFGKVRDNDKAKNLLSANEVVAYAIAKEMNIKCVPYFPVRINNTSEIVCACPCFVNDERNEFVNANQIKIEKKTIGGYGLYSELKKMGLGEDVDNMILFDHIIHNIDRHERNFGVIRDAETLEIKCFAPLFDSGSSFRYNYAPNLSENNETKPFAKDREAQLNMIENPVINIEPSFITNQLKETYDTFQIPSEFYDIAKADVLKSFQMFQKEKLEIEEEWER